MLSGDVFSTVSWPLVIAAGALAAVACGGGSPSAPTGGIGPGGGREGQIADVVAVGDIGWCGSTGTPAAAQLVDSLPGRLLLVGDIAYPNGSAQDFQRCFDPSWGRFRGRWHASPGNHDYLTPNASAYFDYFGGAAGDERSGYYTLVVGDWQILMLDSNIPTQRNSPQWEFVRRELDLQRRPCTLALWHHPLFSSGQNGPNLYMRDMYALPGMTLRMLK